MWQAPNSQTKRWPHTAFAPSVMINKKYIQPNHKQSKKRIDSPIIEFVFDHIEFVLMPLMMQKYLCHY